MSDIKTANFSEMDRILQQTLLSISNSGKLITREASKHKAHLEKFAGQLHRVKRVQGDIHEIGSGKISDAISMHMLRDALNHCQEVIAQVNGKTRSAKKIAFVRRLVEVFAETACSITPLFSEAIIKQKKEINAANASLEAIDTLKQKLAACRSIEGSASNRKIDINGLKAAVSQVPLGPETAEVTSLLIICEQLIQRAGPARVMDGPRLLEYVRTYLHGRTTFNPFDNVRFVEAYFGATTQRGSGAPPRYEKRYAHLYQRAYARCAWETGDYELITLNRAGRAWRDLSEVAQPLHDKSQQPKNSSTSRDFWAMELDQTAEIAQHQTWRDLTRYIEEQRSTPGSQAFRQRLAGKSANASRSIKELEDMHHTLKAFAHDELDLRTGIKKAPRKSSLRRTG